MQLASDFGPLVFINMMVVLYSIPIVIVSMTTLTVAINKTSSEAINQFCSELSFPLDFVFKSNTRGNPSYYLRSVTLSGSACGPLISFTLSLVLTLLFSAFTLYEIVWAINDNSLIRLMLNLSIGIFVIVGIVVAVQNSRRILYLNQIKRKNT